METHCKKCGDRLKAGIGGIVIHVGNGTMDCDKVLSLDEIFPTKKPDILPPERVVTLPADVCPTCGRKVKKTADRKKYMQEYMREYRSQK